MKKLLIALAFSANTFGQGFVAKPKLITETLTPTLEIGSKAPDFRLPGVDGKFHTLAEYAKSNVLVLIFTCNHCPTAQAYEDRMKNIVTDYKAMGVQVVAISPNSPIGVLYEELGYTEYDDDYASMIKAAKARKFNFPYLYDGDDHRVSIKYGPVATPHAYVFDKNRILQYQGRLDALERPNKGGKAEDLRAAIDAVLEGKKPALASTKVFGCSTKWAWKNEHKVEMDKKWSEAQVSLNELDAAGLKDLLANKTDKLLLINVWATWCGPCIVEYPDFVATHRMYSDRDFEFVSISADALDAKERAQKILQKKNSNLRNYIFSGGDTYKLIELIDPKWNGALPYTMLIEPGGKVYYSYQGSIKPLELRKTIVDHPKIGRFF